MFQDDDTGLRDAVSVRGRGTGSITKSRFDRVQVSYAPEDAAQVETQIFRDASRTIIARNDSPDVGFSASVNPYRGCEHGCIYCYARPTHEYMGLSAGLDFETRIFAKMEAPALLAEALRSKSWEPQVLAFSGVTDCYQPVERELKLTRGCLEVAMRHRNPVVVITKNHLVTRDIDLLSELARHGAARVIITVTTLDGELARSMEPRASRPELRLKAVSDLKQAGIPVGVNMAPVIPGLTDHEIPSLVRAAAAAGADCVNYTMLRLPHGVKDLFAGWLAEHYPLRQQKVLNRLRDISGGKLYSPEFGSRMVGSGIFAQQVERLFAQSRKASGLGGRIAPLSTRHFRREPEQASLFDMDI